MRNILFVVSLLALACSAQDAAGSEPTPPPGVPVETDPAKCATVKQILKNYLASGNFRDMADEFRRGEVGFVTKRYAESCGLDSDPRMIKLIQAGSGRRSIIGSALFWGWVLQRKYVRAADSLFGILEDGALTSNKTAAREAAETAGVVGAAMPVFIDHNDRYQKWLARKRATNPHFVGPGEKAWLKARGLASSASSSRGPYFQRNKQQLISMAKRSAPRMTMAATAMAGQSVSAAQAAAAVTNSAQAKSLISRMARGGYRGGKYVVRGSVEATKATGRAIVKTAKFLPGVSQAAALMTKTVTPLRFALMGHAAVMTGKHLHERNWGKAAKSAVDVVLGGTGTTDLLIDVGKLAHQCVTNSTEMRCVQKLAKGVAIGAKTMAGWAANGGKRMLKCASGREEAAECVDALKRTGRKVANAAVSAARKTHAFLTDKDNHKKWAATARKVHGHLHRGIKSLGKTETYHKLAKGSVKVVKEIGAIGRDAGRDLYDWAKNTDAAKHVAKKVNAAKEHARKSWKKLKGLFGSEVINKT